jgi:hypothetical protein
LTSTFGKDWWMNEPSFFAGLNLTQLEIVLGKCKQYERLLGADYDSRLNFSFPNNTYIQPI